MIEILQQRYWTPFIIAVGFLDLAIHLKKRIFSFVCILRTAFVGRGQQPNIGFDQRWI